MGVEGVIVAGGEIVACSLGLKHLYSTYAG